MAKCMYEKETQTSTEAGKTKAKRRSQHTDSEYKYLTLLQSVSLPEVCMTEKSLIYKNVNEM